MINQYKKLILFLLFFGLQLNADGVERKKYHLLISPWIYNRNFELPSREIDNSINIQLLYGINNRLFFGFNYSVGNNGEKSLKTIPTTSLATTRIYQSSTSKNSETISLNMHFFFWKFLYTSLNIGMEKGFTIDRNNFVLIRGNNYSPQPFEFKTVYDDRGFGSLGLGFRQEIFSHFLLAFEYQRGFIESGKFNRHYTFNPEYYDYNLPYALEFFLFNNLVNGTSLRNTQYEQFYLSAGLAF